MENPQDNPQQDAHAIAKQAINLAYGRGESDPEFHQSLGLINGLSREDIVNMAKLAVAQSNNEEIDTMSKEDQARTKFAESFLLSQLSEVEKDRVLH